ncbi:MAG: hypothetical protein JXB32_13255 [Deltaproteobacteria bacterium]|nr:hypothetical protein [Deltaproteobacteria bacterium]
MTERVVDLGSDARLAALVGDVVTVDTPEPHPVGARVVLRDGVATVPGKVVEALRRGKGYRLRLRLFSPSAAVRAALTARLAGRTDPDSFPESPRPCR